MGLKVPIKKYKLFFTISFFIYFCLILTGVKQFNVWNQIIYGYESHFSLLDYFDNFGSHTVRLILMHPIMKFSEIYDFDKDFVFSIIGFFIIMLMIRINNKIIDFYYSATRIKVIFLCLIFVFSFIMNGRNLFSFLGYSLFTYYAFSFLEQKNGRYNFFILILGLIFSSVSSGTFSTLIIYIILFNLYNFIINKLTFKRKAILFLQSITAIALFSPMFYVGLKKNLDYYNGSFITMMSHGFGAYLNNIYVLIFGILGVLILSPIILIGGYFLIKKMDKDSYSTIALPAWISSVIGGVFGYSALIGGLPILFISILIFIDKKIIKLKF